MRRPVSSLRSVSLALLALVITGCQSAPAPDKEVTTAPTGLWVSTQNSDTTLDIQASGDLRYMNGSQEQLGKWTAKGNTAIEATINGQVYEMPYTRNDLTLKITLPGSSSPTEFTQM